MKSTLCLNSIPMELLAVGTYVGADVEGALVGADVGAMVVGLYV